MSDDIPQYKAPSLKYDIKDKEIIEMKEILITILEKCREKYHRDYVENLILKIDEGNIAENELYKAIFYLRVNKLYEEKDGAGENMKDSQKEYDEIVDCLAIPNGIIVCRPFDVR